MYCNYCGHFIETVPEKEAKYCNFCGKSLTQISERQQMQAQLLQSGSASHGKGLIILSVLGGIFIALILMWIGAVNGFPEFIRRIKGKDFVGVFVFVLLVSVSLSAVGALLYIKVKKKSAVDALRDVTVPDADMMLLQRFDRYKLAGYYILKAKLDGVLVYAMTQTAPESEAQSCVCLSKKLTEEALEEYCQKNPYIKPLILYIRAYNDLGIKWLTVNQLVQALQINPSYESNIGRFTDGVIKRIKRNACLIVSSGYAVSLWFGVTKLMMGLYNGKPVSDLVSSMIVLGSVSLIAIYKVRASADKIMVNMASVISDSTKNTIGDITRAFYESEMNRVYTPEEAEEMLRIYTVTSFDGTYFKTGEESADNSTDSFFHALGSVVVASSAALAASQNNSSGCSACSACSSCGGCGGCGD